MDIADGVRDRPTMHERHLAGVEDHADRPPARVRSCEWHTGRAKMTSPAKTKSPVSTTLELVTLDFTRDHLCEVRRFVAQRAAEASLDPDRIADLVLAVNELATNSVRHGGGMGTLRIWSELDTLLCEVSDKGHMQKHSVSLTPADPTQISGRGLWIVQQLCDLVQIHSSHRRSVVRVHMRLT